MRDMLKPFLSTFLLLLCVQAVKGCIEAERNALLDVKAGLVDPTNRSSSWEGKNCCSWSGVACNNKSGRVSKLDLRSNDSYYELCFSGEISSSLSILSDLVYLDLSYNNFTGTRIPSFIGSFKRLRYLNLSKTIFLGGLPPQLGNLSNLNYLDLSELDINHDPKNIWWLKGLPSLKYLDLSGIDLSSITNWFLVVNKLSSLEVLHLSGCSLRPKNNVSVTHINLTRLKVLDLSDNYLPGIIPFELSSLINVEVLLLNINFFDTYIPNTFNRLCNLNTLDMSGNNFMTESQFILNGLPRCVQKSLQVLKLSDSSLMGNIPQWLERMTNLVILDLSGNSLNGTIPRWLEGMAHLVRLDLSSNSLNGTIPEEVWKLPLLTELFLDNNMFDGVITELHLGNLRSIKKLYLSNNKLVVRSDNWHPNFGLKYVGLDSCRVGPKFPLWLRGQTQLEKLHLLNNNIVDTLPQWFWNITHSMSYLDLSNNQIRGELEFSSLDTNMMILNLSHNLIEGPLLQAFFSSELYILDLSSNNINGSIPSSICEFPPKMMHLSNNKLSGELPECMGYPDYASLRILDLANNYLSGNIPSFFCSNKTLVMKLTNNFFSGELPISFKKFNEIVFLDLGNNKFSGTIPTWIGEPFRNLAILNLRSNMFHGSIPQQIALLQSLQILDLSHNNLSETIPMAFGNYSGMFVSSGSPDLQNIVYLDVNDVHYVNYVNYKYLMSLTIKDRTLDFSNTLPLMTSIDISDNNFSGEIPGTLGNLSGLHNLNLSRNHLSGRIPETIGKMQSLESLDLSMNDLSGLIPQTLSDLTSLSVLNLSYNNLSGVIPTGTQLQTLNDPSIYKGNPFLCGPQISKSCTKDYNKTVYSGDTNHEEDGSNWLWLYIGSVCGFVMGFWSLFGALILKTDWRYAYIYMIDAFIDRVYVAGALFFARCMRKFRK